MWLNASDYEFWDFSFEEISTYDTPAVVSYILNVTGAAKVAFVGHSQGTTQMFYALAYY
jgi:lysosomal acid lipase/cholesteryl ester hydrolase